jgi:cob(I)alamin adenosyltransferase
MDLHMKLYTRTGDDGTTALFDGTRIAKDHLRVSAYGDVDELNAALGLVVASLRSAGGNAAAAGHAALMDRLTSLQAELFVVGADLATPMSARHRTKTPEVNAAQVTRLETWIDEAVAAVPPLKNFILPGGSEPACRLHAARTVARRAERAVVALARGERIGTQIVPYLNRLNDLLFAWARLANSLAGIPDVIWIAPAAPTPE